MIVMGAGHQPLVPLRPDLPGDARAGALVRLPGRQRRRLGALRRPGEGPPDHRLRQTVAFALDWTRPPRQQAGDAVLVPGHRPVALRELRRRRVHLARGPRRSWAASTSPTLHRAGGAAGLAAALPDASTATRSTSATRPRRRARSRRPSTSSTSCARPPALRLRGPRRPGELPAGPHAVAREPARLLEQGARVLPAPHARRPRRRRPRRRVAAEGSARRRSTGATRRRTASSTCSRRSTSG